MIINIMMVKKYKIIILTITIFSNLLSQCNEYEQLQCENDEFCNWVNDYEWANCSNYNNSQDCNATGHCWWSWDASEWQDTCSGGSFQLDTSYCEEIDFELGDINNDFIINVLDVIEVANLIQNNSYNQFADINNDQIINILDAILIINIILGR